MVTYVTVGFKQTTMCAHVHIHTSQVLFGFIIVSVIPMGQANEGPWMK